MARSSVLLLFLCALACGGPDETTNVLDARIITADGANPLTTGDFDTLRITWAQEGFETAVREVDLSGDDFEVPFELDPFANARARVELSGPGGRLVGAPPFFAPIEASPDGLTVVVGEPGTCAVLPRLAAPEPARAESAYVNWQGFVIQVGGQATSGPTAAMTFSDLYSMAAGTPLMDLPEQAGRTKAAIIGGTDVALLTELSGPWRYQLSGADAEENRTSPLTLHPTAGIGSAVIRTARGAVLVAGGGDAATPSGELARIAADGAVELGGLVGARAFAAGALAGESDAVVAGGTRATGAPFVEWVDMATLGSTTVDDPAAELVRNEPLVIAGESSHWIVGGTDDSGAPITTSWVLSGCPAACALEPGPEVDLGTAPSAMGLTITDGTSVSIAVEAGGWRLEPIADLVRERRSAGIGRLESGVVFVHGGRDDAGPHLDGELCFPAGLIPLE